MTTLVLTNRISQSSARTQNQRVTTVTYGDGYEQRSQWGINARRDSWTIEWIGLDATESATLNTFWQSVGLLNSWTWTAPGDSTEKTWVFASPLQETNTGFYSNFSITAREVSPI